MRHENILFVFFIIGFLFFSCRKETSFIEPEWVPGPCDVYVLGPGFIVEPPQGLSFVKQFPFYDYPCFNPNNENEIAFREEWLEDTLVNDTLYKLIKTGLVKYNMATGEKQLIYKGPVGPRPRWSRKGWILLNLPDYKIYKIKSDGSNLTQLTFEGKCLGPEWDKQGNRFIYELVSGNGNISVICDEDGNELFRNEGASISPSWQHDSLLVNVGAAVVTVNPISLEYETIQESGVGGEFGAEWLDDENIIWSNYEGVFVSNRISKVTKKIRETCVGDYFYEPIYNDISEKVVLVRLDRTITEPENFIGTGSQLLYKMNTDGTGLEKIDVPEW